MDNIIQPHDILTRFMNDNSMLVTEMENSSHNYSHTQLNSYHLEGSVWTHTMMVFNYARINNFPIEVLFATLLHDVGKPSSRITKTRKNGEEFYSFQGHEGVSFYKSIDILNGFNDILTDEQQNTILKLVACHSVLFPHYTPSEKLDEKLKHCFANDSDFLNLLSKLVESDSNGRITSKPEIIRTFNDFETYNKTSLYDAPSLTVLIGVPNSGKSTWLIDNAGDSVIISSDQVIEDTVDGVDYNDKFRKADFKQIDDILDKQFRKAVKERRNIVIDRTNMSKKSRRRWVNNARFYNKEAVLFVTPEETIMSRNSDRIGKIIPCSVISNMMKAFSYPLHDEFNSVSIIKRCYNV